MSAPRRALGVLDKNSERRRSLGLINIRSKTVKSGPKRRPQQKKLAESQTILEIRRAHSEIEKQLRMDLSAAHAQQQLMLQHAGKIRNALRKMIASPSVSQDGEVTNAFDPSKDALATVHRLQQVEAQNKAMKKQIAAVLDALEKVSADRFRQTSHASAGDASAAVVRRSGRPEICGTNSLAISEGKESRKAIEPDAGTRSPQLNLELDEERARGDTLDQSLREHKRHWEQMADFREMERASFLGRIKQLQQQLELARCTTSTETGEPEQEQVPRPVAAAAAAQPLSVELGRSVDIITADGNPANVRDCIASTAGLCPQSIASRAEHDAVVRAEAEAAARVATLEGRLEDTQMKWRRAVQTEEQRGADQHTQEAAAAQELKMSEARCAGTAQEVARLEQVLTAARTARAAAESRARKQKAATSQARAIADKVTAEACTRHEMDCQRHRAQAAAWNQDMAEKAEQWSQQKALLLSQLDRLCEAMEGEGDNGDGSSSSPSESVAQQLDSAKVELEELKRYLMVYKDRADQKANQLKSQVQDSGADIAALDSKLLRMKAVLAAIVSKASKEGRSYDVLGTVKELLQKLSAHDRRR